MTEGRFGWQADGCRVEQAGKSDAQGEAALTRGKTRGTTHRFNVGPRVLLPL